MALSSVGADARSRSRSRSSFSELELGESRSRAVHVPEPQGSPHASTATLSRAVETRATTTTGESPVDGSEGAPPAPARKEWWEHPDHDGYSKNLVEVANVLGKRSSRSSCAEGKFKRNGSVLRKFIHTIFISGLGFFADAYDLFVIDFVVAILSALSVEKPTASDKSLVVSATLAGAVCGQLGFGFLADFLGRRLMFLGTALFLLLGGMTSACCGLQYHGEYSDMHGFTIWQQLAITRFILGLGIGGEYPLSATVSSESQEDDEEFSGDSSCFARRCGFVVKRPNVVAAVFSMQGMGNLFSCFLSMILLSANLRLDIVWRLLLLFGSLPSSIAFAFRWRMSETNQFKKAQAKLAEGKEYSAFAVDNASLSESSPESCSLGQVAHSEMDLGLNEKRSVEADVVLAVRAFSEGALLHNSNASTTSEEARPEPQLSSGTDAIARMQEAARQARIDNADDDEGSAGCNIKALTTFGAYLSRTGKVIYAYRKALIGTAVTWFLIDVTLYGNGSFKTAVIAEWLGISSSKRMLLTSSSLKGYDLFEKPFLQHLDPLFQRALQSVGLAKDMDLERRQVLREVEYSSVVAALALPGYYLSVGLIHKIGCKRLQVGGFYMIAFLFFLLGLEQQFKVDWMWLELLLFGGTFLFSNFGPNTTTFILPTELYPSVVRATCHGLSAASGKMGGVVGTSLFSVVQTKFGMPVLLFACAVVSLLGALATHVCIPKDVFRKPRLGSVAVEGYHPQHLYHPDRPLEHPHKYSAHVGAGAGVGAGVGVTELPGNDGNPDLYRSKAPREGPGNGARGD